MHNALISLGSNSNGEVSLRKMRSLFRVWIKDVKESPTLTNPAIGMTEGTPDFTNQLLRLQTSLKATDLTALCKKAEKMCGSTKEDRLNGVITADADLLLYDEKKYHERDWEHPYIKTLLKHVMVILLLIVVQTANAQTSVKEDLGKAIEYFSGQKYHEALLYFNKLEKNTVLSPRFRAYKGVCEFKEEKFDDAINTLAPVIDEMGQYAPLERALYDYAIGESYFQLGKYNEAIPFYSKAYDVALENDKAELCYRLGFCELKCDNEGMAIIWFQTADSLYNNSVLDDLTKAHRAQNKRMLKALLIAHGTSRVDSGDEVAWQDEDQNTDDKSADVDKKPDDK